MSSILVLTSRRLCHTHVRTIKTCRIGKAPPWYAPNSGHQLTPRSLIHHAARRSKPQRTSLTSLLHIAPISITIIKWLRRPLATTSELHNYAAPWPVHANNSFVDVFAPCRHHIRARLSRLDSSKERAHGLTLWISLILCTMTVQKETPLIVNIPSPSTLRHEYYMRQPILESDSKSLH